MNAITPSAQASRQIRVTLPKVTLAMLVCGIVSAGAIGAASAATPGDASGDVLAVTVKYDAASLDSDVGARRVYKRIVNAAAVVCPQAVSSPHWITRGVKECREQSIARAVMKINHPRLVAVYQSSVRHG